MNIARGTFRLSIIVAVTVTLYFGIAAHVEAFKAESESRRIWTTLQCGKPFLDRDMSRYTNEYGNIDIGRAGCSSSSFFATFDEIRMALSSVDPPDADEYWRLFRIKGTDALIYGVFAFLLVNVGAFLFLGARKIFRWIAAGYAQQG